jgi:glyceraldehyde 3-phosphate dehydrogenase
VIESTGRFTDKEGAEKHLRAGAKKVVISAPSKGEGIKSYVLGVNADQYSGEEIIDNASCTTNCAAPPMLVLEREFGIEKAMLTTVHSYTASQVLQDGPSKDLREARAAAQNIVPSSTGAAIAVTKAFPKLNNLFDGISLRVPVPAGSIVDVTFLSKKNTTALEVNEILKKAAKNPKWEGIFTVTEEDLVSSDILGEPYASIADLQFTRVVGGNLIKVLAWYDNESGYTRTLIKHVLETGQY